MNEPTPTIEDLAPAAYAGPVARTVAPRGGRFGLRWVVALIVVALVAATTAAGAWFLAGQAGTSSLAGWVPSDSVVYVEGRIDLPGDQRQQLGNFLAHFPGFKDQSILDDKIAEAFDRAISGATDGRHDYATEIRPWFGGEIAGSVGPLPQITSSSNSPPAFRALLLAAIKDDAAADAWVAKVASDAPTPPTTVSYHGVAIRSTSTADAGGSGAVAVLDHVLLAGDLASVKAAIDTGGTSGLAANSSFASATSRLDGDHLGAMWANMRAYLRWSASIGGVGAGAAVTQILDLAPEWVATDVRATNGDALTTRSVVPHIAAYPNIPRGPSVLPAHVPSSALAVLDAHDVGTILKSAIETSRATPAMARALTAVDQGLAAFGGEDAALGWIGEAAFVAVPDGDSMTGGVLVAPKDHAKADAFVRQLRNFIALGGATLGISSRDEDHGGTTIAIVKASDLARLGEPLGAPGLEGDVEVAFAARDDLVVAGSPAFVRAALDTTADASLGSSSRFSGSLARVGSDTTTVGWLDIAAVRGLIERSMPAGDDRTRYEHDVKPYLEPLDVLVYGQAAGSDVDTGTISLITK
ncbi:MAG TPA: DUF3352 domain-containing protein [Candidatus Limnocylindrales bacterium]|nr:DUF3352 domain-containing protein [Candidatus Limnocylindrales bacterium]